MEAGAGMPKSPGIQNENQRSFCQASGAAVRLLAPAGCGKTQSLLWRCVHLAETATAEKPKFLLFTFTRAAREELNDRVRSDTSFRVIAQNLTITTLNSWGFRRLKSLKHNLRLITDKGGRYFTLNNVLQPVWNTHPRLAKVLTESRSKNRASAALMDLIDLFKSLGFRHDRLESPKDLEAHVAFLENCGMASQFTRVLQQLEDLEVLVNLNNPIADLHEHFVKFWCEATTHLYQSAIVSWEDQKYWSMIDLEQQVKKKTFWTGAARYHHVLVDEFQDINPLDLSLLRAIAEVNKSDLTIVGDDDQAIYEWRAATPDFILSPDKHIKNGYTTIVLETNYRSPKNIVELSQRLISNNKRRVEKNVVASSSTNASVDVLGMPSLANAIDYVVQLVKDLLADATCKNVAIIGRKRSQIIPYQIVFASQDIPFYAAEDLHVFLSDAFEELNELLAIRARADVTTAAYGGSPVDDILTLCDKVKRYPLAKKDRESLRGHLRRAAPKTLRSAVHALRTYTGPIKGNNDGGRMASSFADAVRELLDSKTVATSIAAISGHFDGLKKDYGKSLDDIFYADPPFLYLGEYAHRYGDDYAKFGDDMQRAVETLARIPPEEEEHGDQTWKLPLHLMTALRAKGKEFDAVIVLDANEGIWPSKLAVSEFEQEQERRLFYVAMTRTRKRLVFLVNDSILDEAALPTRYLGEMGLAVRPIDV